MSPNFLYQYRTSRKARRENALLPALRVGTAGILAVFLAWLLLFPHLSGDFGRWVGRGLTFAFGAAAYLLPIFILNAVAVYVRSEKSPGWITMGLGSLLILLGTAVLSNMIGAWLFTAKMAGGMTGMALHGWLSRWLGGFGCALTGLAAGLAGIQIVARIRWSKLAGAVALLLAEDYRAWLRSRRELEAWRERSSQVRKAAPRTAEAPPRAEAALPPPMPVPGPARAAQENSRKEKPQETTRPPERSRPPAGRPPITLLEAAAQDQESWLPTQAELASATESLESTLRSFQIQATVTGTVPGPVITRYEVSPAPGVKVSSIVALENDIALAMRAKGIRMIAPIPGKAAVGIEIPNARTATVTLREVLDSPVFHPKSPPLSFAVGLTSDGEPLAADLAAMPHVLIGGATGTGKSVFIQSLILSLLFREGPDRVKFLLIDPKRLELSFYAGIPHLFDPCVPAESVAVVTDCKAAARSLAATVKIMEQRYKLFEAVGARNIEGYNQLAPKKGLPKEYFIVVVVDELADLILVAGEAVEDSIQRLAQMARAVGIHLVLATQQPTVDVITGVIKANLPCRVALQVTSDINSRVILNETGAEKLQGRGDLLYLAAGAQKPVRCQGSYVTEDEIRRVVEFLRTTGKPDYPPLETMPKPGEADLKSFGVEPGEFRDALKLVIERRRVSQDLLKSQFGSSARATNLLSLLEVKGMINKPEGTNRWEIDFEGIEAYLRLHFSEGTGPS